MKTVIAIQARLKSTRLPRKILAEIGGKPLISQLFRRMRAVRAADDVVISCPYADAGEVQELTMLPCRSGPEEDVLTRLLIAAKGYDFLVRVTADCPAMPPDLVEHMISDAVNRDEVVQNWRPRAYPDGFDCEVWPVKVLLELSDSLTGDDREWFAQAYLDQKKRSFHPGGDKQLAKMRLTVDYPEDLEVIEALYSDMGDEVWGARRIIEWCYQNPRIMRFNKMHVKDFGARPV